MGTFQSVGFKGGLIATMIASAEMTPRRSAREQILDTAYELFTQRGIRAVGVDEVIARSGVAKATLYKHFRSKNELAMAFLQRREQRWSRDFIEAGSAQRRPIPKPSCWPCSTCSTSGTGAPTRFGSAHS